MWRRDRRTPIVQAGVLAVLALAMFALVYWATVRTEPGRLFGDASLRGAIRTQSGLTNGVDQILGIVSVASLLAGIAAIALVALTRLRRSAGLVAVGIVAAANASTWVLKRYLLPRPDFGLAEISPATHNSLPSGHTTAVFSVVVAVLFVVPAQWRSRVALAGGATAVVVGLATMSAGWHRAGDSVAAFFLVDLWAAVGAVVAVVVGKVRRRNYLEDETPYRPPRRPFLIVAGAAVGGLMLATALVLVGSLRSSGAGSAFAFVAGALFIAAGAALALFAVLAVLDRLEL
ncbi:MAG: phosphatase PAP2 family protein [Jatrophihabitans sp.]